MRDPNWPMDLKARLGRLGKVGMEVTVELGRASLTLERILNLGQGHLVELGKSGVAPVDVRVNGAPFGKGEIIVVGDHVAVRMTELLKPDQMQKA